MRLPRDQEIPEFRSLLRAAKGGSDEATGKLLQSYRNYLLLIANRQLGSQLGQKGSPSDVVQETLMDASRSLTGFQGEDGDDLVRWLRKILRNNVATLAERYRNTEKRDVSKEESPDSLDDKPSKGMPPSRVLIAEEHARIIRQSIAGLPTHQRRALALRYQSGASYEEIGQILNRSPEAVRKLTARGTEELRKAIQFAGLNSVSVDLHFLVGEQIFDNDHLWDNPDEKPDFRQLRQFEILGELGSGAFGIVFHARDGLTGQEVALKVPRPHVLKTIPLRNRFIREAVVLSRLSHPQLVPIYEAGQVGPVCYLATAYCPGPTLGAWLAEGGVVSPREAIQLTQTLAEAIGYIHSRNVLHRDIKPTNILLEPRGDFDNSQTLSLSDVRPKLTDFGLAKILEEDDHDTPTGITVGTAAYMAPEQIVHCRTAGPPADLYSLGVVLYEMLTGATPQVASQVLQKGEVSVRQFVPLRTVRPDIAPALEAICHRCLSHEVAARYGSANELLLDLCQVE